MWYPEVVLIVIDDVTLSSSSSFTLSLSHGSKKGSESTSSSAVVGVGESGLATGFDAAWRTPEENGLVGVVPNGEV
jgi:hypothetical protein